MKTVTVIGGGTGTFVVLTGLKDYQLNLGVIVTMMDSGGSTGRLRDQLGVLPPGDLRQCLVALSEASVLWRKLFLYRFDKGDLKGHNFGNIFLSALEKVCRDYDQVIETASFVLKTKGRVIPVTEEKSHLCVEYFNGRVVKGEGNIDENNQEKTRIKEAFLDREVKVNPKAINQIKKSDYIVIGPGDLYTSIIPILLVKGISKAFKKSKAKVIYVVNLMTKSGQTTDYTAWDHCLDLKRYLGKMPDYVLINTGPVPKRIRDWYEAHSEKVVVNDLEEKGYKGKIISGDLIYRGKIKKAKGDSLTRSILRHDPKILGETIYKITEELF